MSHDHDGHMFNLWCDSCGICKGMTEEEFDDAGCSDEMQMACILRYLRAPGENIYGETMVDTIQES